VDNDKKILRYTARFNTRVPEDIDRRFIISFYLQDDSISVYARFHSWQECPSKGRKRESNHVSGEGLRGCGHRRRRLFLLPKVAAAGVGARTVRRGCKDEEDGSPPQLWRPCIPSQQARASGSQGGQHRFWRPKYSSSRSRGRPSAHHTRLLSHAMRWQRASRRVGEAHTDSVSSAAARRMYILDSKWQRARPGPTHSQRSIQHCRFARMHVCGV